MSFGDSMAPKAPGCGCSGKRPDTWITHLYQDRNDGDRYVTIDRWESEEAFKDFRASFAEEFERLDRDGEHLTLEETPLGELKPMA